MATKLYRNYWTLAYVASIVFVNWAFTALPLLHFGADVWSPASLIVGGIFVVRDFAQREVGHKILIASAVGIVISYFMAAPGVAVASATAFAISELMDWAVFSFVRSSFKRRVVFSSLVGVPTDTLVFMYMLGIVSPTGWAIMTASKLVALFGVAFMRNEPCLGSSPELN